MYRVWSIFHFHCLLSEEMTDMVLDMVGMVDMVDMVDMIDMLEMVDMVTMS